MSAIVTPGSWHFKKIIKLCFHSLSTFYYIKHLFFWLKTNHAQNKNIQSMNLYLCIEWGPTISFLIGPRNF